MAHRGSAAACFDILLSEVFDYVSLEELLLGAMPVNRHWREQAIDHWVYWERLLLNKDQYGSLALKSVDLFLLRLSRTRDRPIYVRVWDVDLLPVIGAIAGHLQQIRVLVLYGAPSSSVPILAALCQYPAPQLNVLRLSFARDITRMNGDPVNATPIPRDLFASHAPMLQHVAINSLVLNSGADFPSALSAATTLEIVYVDRAVNPSRYALPDISLHFPHLRVLDLGPNVRLDDPNFLEPSTWRDLESVTFHSTDVGDHHDRIVTSLPIMHMRRLTMSCSHAYDAIELANTVIGPLCVIIPTHSIYPGPFDAHTYTSMTWCMRSSSNQEMLRRWVDTYLPHQAPGEFPAHTIAALQHAPLVDRIISLYISLAEWDILVGQGYLACFPALEVLVISLIADPHHAFWRGDLKTSQLSCPVLNRITLTHILPTFPRAVRVALIAAFVGSAVPDARFPVVLELRDLAFEGTIGDYPDVFSSLVETVRSSTENDDLKQP
ncbi:hypothetical protein AURDEDRAFT_161536 [Auricularia subglabra TFB-10046 SS5]|nr:hypothetical protein AURDEDRAFT_161536 [Auricularia subglabra TFB-10046 SS5]